MKSHAVASYTVRLYMAGDIEIVKQFLRKEVYPPNAGLCVTVEKPTYIYTGGGEEEGFVIGFVNYPRFPKATSEIWKRAFDIAYKLITHLGQWSALLVAPDRTEWLTDKPGE